MSLFKLQEAIYTKLSSDLTESVYDEVPQDAVKPYVVVGDDTFNEWGTGSTNGFDTTITIHSWSAYEGRKEVKELQENIYLSLHRKNLSIVGYNVVDIFQEFSETILDPDGITRHGVQRFRVYFDK